MKPRISDAERYGLVGIVSTQLHVFGGDTSDRTSVTIGVRAMTVSAQGAFKATRLAYQSGAAPTVEPGPDQPAAYLGRLMEDPEVLSKKGAVKTALWALPSMDRVRLACACEAKLFPAGTKVKDLDHEQIEMRAMLQRARSAV